MFLLWGYTDNATGVSWRPNGLGFGVVTAVALVQSLAREPLHAVGTAKKKKQTKNKNNEEFLSWLSETYPTSTHEDTDSVPGLAQCIKDLALA